MIQESGQGALYLIFNAGANRSDFHLPEAPPGFRWHLAIDTFLSPPRDIFAAGEEALLDEARSYRVESGSTAILVARRRVTGGASK